MTSHFLNNKEYMLGLIEDSNNTQLKELGLLIMEKIDLKFSYDIEERYWEYRALNEEILALIDEFDKRYEELNKPIELPLPTLSTH